MNLEERRDYTEMKFRGAAMPILIKYCKCCGSYLYNAKIPEGDTKIFTKMFDDYLSGHVCLLRSVSEYEKGRRYKDLYEMTIIELEETLVNRNQQLGYEIWRLATLTRSPFTKNFPDSPQKACPELYPKKQGIKMPSFLIEKAMKRGVL